MLNAILYKYVILKYRVDINTAAYCMHKEGFSFIIINILYIFEL